MFIENRNIVLIVLLIVLSFMFIRKEKDNLNIYYYDLNNNLAIEKVDLPFFLNFLYKNSLGKVLRSLLAQKFMSKFMAIYPNSSFSRYITTLCMT